MAVMAFDAPRRAHKRRNLAPKVSFAAPQSGSGHTQSSGGTVLDMLGAPVAHSAAGNLVVRTQAQKGSEVSLGGKPTHIHTDFGDDGLCGHDIDAIDLSQVGAADAV
jgi:hypothetical protein